MHGELVVNALDDLDLDKLARCQGLLQDRSFIENSATHTPAKPFLPRWCLGKQYFKKVYPEPGSV